MHACLGSPVVYRSPYGLYCKFIDRFSTAKSCILRQVLLHPLVPGIIESTEPIADYSAAT